MLEAIIRLGRLATVMYPVAASTWLFPSDAPVGHIIEHKEDRSMLSHWGNDLRQTYRTLGQAADLTDVDTHLLMNHALRALMRVTSRVQNRCRTICAISRRSFLASL
jgi:hypothetical protein